MIFFFWMSFVQDKQLIYDVTYGRHDVYDVTYGRHDVYDVTYGRQEDVCYTLLPTFASYKEFPALQSR